MSYSTSTGADAAAVAILLLLIAAAVGVAAQGPGGYGGYQGGGGGGGGGGYQGGGGGYGYDGDESSGGAGDLLSMEHYSMTCPYAEMIVRDVVGDAIYKDPTLAASLLRLHFHDCFVRGCDASVLLDSTHKATAEKDALTNKSLRGFEVIDAVKAALEDRCPGTVSCADVLALAARDSVYMAGGPYYDVATGRRDGFVSDAADTSALPAATLQVSELKTVFASHGFTVAELVALSGAHTLGQAHCANFKNRVSGNKLDPTLDAQMAATLATTCKKGGDGATAKLDATSNVFDTDYFRGIQGSKALLTSDQTLAGSPDTSSLVHMFADSPDMFFDTFIQGMIKMGTLDLNPKGNVRKSCRIIN